MLNPRVWIVKSNKMATSVSFRNGGWPWLRDNKSEGTRKQFPRILLDGRSGDEGGTVYLEPSDSVIMLGQDNAIFKPNPATVTVIGEITLGQW